jgi:phosphoribosylglycinamide formyltransferase 1
LPLKVAVMISGTGSNMLAIARACQHNPALQLDLVLSDQPSALGIERAQALNIPTIALARTDFASRDAHESAIARALHAANIDVVALAGFMRVLSAGFVAQFKDRLINIHPSLLPHYPGLNTHTRVLQDKQTEHGASVHVVTQDLDAGAIISQGVLSVNPHESAAQLQQRVQQIEHQIYPAVLSAWASGQLKIVDSQPFWDNQPLVSPRRERFPHV